MKNVLKTIIADFHSQRLRPVLPRNMILPVNTGIIISLIVVRRSGKTYLLYDTIKRLISAGIQKRNIVYINFEDERLSLEKDSLDLILQAYLELYPEKDLAECYFFFDEIQNVDGWEKFVRRIYDTISRNIFITGSNATLLSTEIATELRGRSVSYTLYPLSFSEYLDFNKAEKEYSATIQRVKLAGHFRMFMLYGGFPELIDLDDTLKIKKLQDNFNTIIYRDLVERYDISNSLVLKFFLKRILSQATKPFSVNRIWNDLRSVGYRIGNNTLYEYADHIQASFASLMINRFDYSGIRQALSEKKAYAIDNGILTAVDWSFSENHGKLLENLVALELLKSGKDVMYFSDTRECDFIITEKLSWSAIQVCYSLKESDTYERETDGLVNACKYLKLKSGTILTYEEESEIKKDDITIEVLPAYKYVLERL